MVVDTQVLAPELSDLAGFGTVGCSVEQVFQAQRLRPLIDITAQRVGLRNAPVDLDRRGLGFLLKLVPIPWSVRTV